MVERNHDDLCLSFVQESFGHQQQIELQYIGHIPIYDPSRKEHLLHHEHPQIVCMQTLCHVLYKNQEECTHQKSDRSEQTLVEDLQVYSYQEYFLQIEKHLVFHETC